MKPVDKMKKIAELARRGVGGEAEAARRLLSRMQKQYEVTDSELEAAEESWHPFTFRTKYEEKLLCQIAWMVAPHNDTMRTHRYKKRLDFYLTDQQADEVAVLFSIYRTSLVENFEVMYLAFLHENHIFPKDSKHADEREMSHDEIEKRLRAEQMRAGIKRAQVFDQIEDGK